MPTVKHKPTRALNVGQGVKYVDRGGVEHDALVLRKHHRDLDGEIDLMYVTRKKAFMQGGFYNRLAEEFS